jgi:hypothetical protein
MPSNTDASQPSYVRPEVAATQADLALVHDLLAGTRRMHERSSSYIRKWKDEDDKVYEIRRQCETVFEGLGRTLSAAVGMLFAKAPAVEWNQAEAAMTEHWADIDGAGAAGPVLVKRFAEASTRDGIGLILVDHPPAPKDAQGNPITITAANEGALGLRPRWALYSRSQAINWRVGRVNNRSVLTLLVLHEPTQVEVGLYGIATVERYRVLRLIPEGGAMVATWALYELVKDRDGKERFENKGSGYFRNRAGQLATFLPVSIAYTGRSDAPMTATIPLLGVAWANLSHWQQATNLRFYRDLCAFPQPTVIGQLANDPVTQTAGVLRVGPMVAVHLEGEGASYAWTELEGTSMAQIVEGREEAMRQISKLGVSFLATDTRAAETAEAKRLDATAENSTLATAAQGIEDAVNMALEHHAWFLGIEKSGAPTITLSRDYESTGMPSDMLIAYVRAIADAGLPPRLLLDAMQRGGLIGADEDIDALELEMMASAAAKEEQRRVEAVARSSALLEGQDIAA